MDLHAAAAACLALRVRRACRRLGEHHAAGAVEVAGKRVDHVDQPTCDGAEGLRCRADPAVDGCARRGRQFACDPADRLGVKAAACRDGLGRERLRRLLNLFDPVQQPVEVVAGCDQSFVEERVDDREAEQRVAAGADEVVLVGGLCCARATRVDHDDLAATLSDLLHPAAEVGRRHHRTVRNERVGAEDQQVVGAVNVRD
ncbi:unannotated protein [freshwater metagenome]|uniref:Unannotated protein n=1 Tax=freshwater metagenome TaxID=449393 RepID=A0A6J6A0E9_9ZZZZ